MLKQCQTICAIMVKKLMKEPGKLILVTKRNDNTLNKFI